MACHRNELCGDVRVRRGSEFRTIQSAVQRDQERGPGLHLRGHGDRHAQQRHAVFLCWLDLRAEPMVLSVPEVEKNRYYAVQLEDGNTFNYGYIGSRATGNDAGDYMVVGPDWKGETPQGIKKVFRSSTQFLRQPAIAPSCSARTICRMWRRSRPATRCSRSPPIQKQPAPPAAPAVDFPKIDKDLVKSNFFEYLDFALQFAPPGDRREGHSRQAREDRRRRRQDLRLPGPPAGPQARDRPRA